MRSRFRPLFLPRRIPGAVPVRVGLVLGLAAIPGAWLRAAGGWAYVRHCASCHGAAGRGDGAAAGDLSAPPRDLTRAEGWRNGASPAAVARTLETGIPGTAMGSYLHLPAAERASVAYWVAGLAADGPVGGGAAPDREVPGNLVLRDESGQPVPMADLLGRPSLLTLNYFKCEGLCSPQLNALASVLGRMEALPGRDFQVLTVSFDPRDTPAVAAGKRDAYLRQVPRAMPRGAWRFLTGEARATRALADAVGFTFEPRDGDFVHPAVLAVLAPGGRVVRILHGLTYEPGDLERAVREAAQPQAQPPAAAGRPERCLPGSAGAHRFSYPGCAAAALALTGLIFLVSGFLRRFLRNRA